MGLARFLSRALYAMAVLIAIGFCFVVGLSILGGASVLGTVLVTIVGGVLAILMTVGLALGGYLLGRVADSSAGEVAKT